MVYGDEPTYDMADQDHQYHYGDTEGAYGEHTKDFPVPGGSYNAFV